MNRLRELRIAKGWESQKAFTSFLNKQLNIEVSPSTISLIELGKNENPYWQLVLGLSRYFGVSTEYLMGVDDVLNTDPTVKIMQETLNERRASIVKE